MSDGISATAPPGPPVEVVAELRRAEIGGGGLRERVAGGTLVNSVYLVGLNVLTMVQGLVVARLLGAGQYGVWGLITVTFGTLLALAAVGLDDKYIQQDHPDQQQAFEIAFTLQAALCGVFTILALIAVPLASLLYGQPRILVPGLLLTIGFPLIALQTPMWVFYRRMNFFRQRVLESVNPLVSFFVTVGLALAGLGYWALVIGTLAAGVAASLVALLNSPYPVRLRWERGALREYASFSWPLLIGSLSGVVAFQVPLTIAARTFGAAAVGAIALASTLTQYTARVDDIVTHALYPAICAVKDRRDLLFESFSKSNQLALMWGAPLGLAAALFAGQAVSLALGPRWKLAVPLIEVLGLCGAADQIGFNWTAFARARGETRILAVGSIAFFVGMLGAGVPLLLTDGLSGFAIGIGAGTAANLFVRLVYLLRLFPAISITSHVFRAAGPALVAAGAVVVARTVIFRGAQGTALEALGYVLIVLLGTWLTERTLMREAVGYLRRAAKRTATPAG